MVSIIVPRVLIFCSLATFHRHLELRKCTRAKLGPSLKVTIRRPASDSLACGRQTRDRHFWRMRRIKEGVAQQKELQVIPIRTAEKPAQYPSNPSGVSQRCMRMW